MNQKTHDPFTKKVLIWKRANSGRFYAESWGNEWLILRDETMKDWDVYLNGELLIAGFRRFGEAKAFVNSRAAYWEHKQTGLRSVDRDRLAAMVEEAS